jgi:hypothetical protein
VSLQFAVIYEAEADFRTATELADRVLVEGIHWLEEDQLDYQRTWLAESTDGRRLTWKAMKQLARDSNLPPVHGHFEGEPALPDAAAARRAIRFLRREFPRLDAIVLIRDQDQQPERRRGLEQAQHEQHGALAIVVGLAVVERECWVISGYDPLDDAESTRLRDSRQQLGFDPRERSHELTACKNDQALRSAKRVLRELTQDDRERQCQCWRETQPATLRKRGRENGLTTYLDAVREQLARLIGHSQ